MKMTRWIALLALPLAAACARGGEADADAALMDTTGSATITGDTVAPATVPLAPMTPDSAAAPAPAAAPADSAQPAAEAHGDSAAH